AGVLRALRLPPDRRPAARDRRQDRARVRPPAQRRGGDGAREAAPELKIPSGVLRLDRDLDRAGRLVRGGQRPTVCGSLGPRGPRLRRGGNALTGVRGRRALGTTTRLD